MVKIILKIIRIHFEIEKKWIFFYEYEKMNEYKKMNEYENEYLKMKWKMKICNDKNDI